MVYQSKVFCQYIFLIIVNTNVEFHNNYFLFFMTYLVKSIKFFLHFKFISEEILKNLSKN